MATCVTAKQSKCSRLPVNSPIYVVMFGTGIAVATIRFRYHEIAVIMKWLVTALFAYVITAFIVGPDWAPSRHI